MPEKKLPKTQIRGLIFLKDNPGVHYTLLFNATKSVGSWKHVAEVLSRKGYATTEDDQHYSITEKGLEVLKEQTSESYNYSLWKY